MANPSVVQVKAGALQSATGAAQTLAFTSTTTAGNTLVMAAANASSISSYTVKSGSSGGTAFTQAVTAGRSLIYYLDNAPSVAGIYVLPNASSTWQISIFELLNTNSAGSLDQTGTQTTIGSTTRTVSTGGATLYAVEVAIAISGDISTSIAPGTPTSWTDLNDTNTAALVSNCSYIVTAASGTQTATWPGSLNATGSGRGNSIATFAGAAPTFSARIFNVNQAVSRAAYFFKCFVPELPWTTENHKRLNALGLASPI